MQKLKVLAMTTLLVLGGAYALASWPWCNALTPTEPAVLSTSVSTEGLRAGAARVELEPPWPVTVAGYAPPHPEASSWRKPIAARALVLSAGEVQVALVLVDVLLVTDELTTTVRAQTGIDATWLIATHAHSSIGGFDRRWLGQVSALGSFSTPAEEAIAKAAIEAVRQAQRSLAPARAELGTLDDSHLSAPRSGSNVDRRLTRVRIVGDKPIAQLVMLAAHPTLAPRKRPQLDPDYPGALADALETHGDGVTLVLQTAGGNAATDQRDGETADAFGERAAALVAELATSATESKALAHVRVSVTLPSTDSSRLVPGLFVTPSNNALCTASPPTAELDVLELGGLTLFAVPGEPSWAAGVDFEKLAAGPARVVSLANGYLGYVETADAVDAREGESKRQYYDRALKSRLQAGLSSALAALDAGTQ